MAIIRTKSQFGLNLEKQLVKREKTLTDLAEKMGITRQRMHQMKYVEKPSKENIRKLCRILRCRKSDLIGDK